MGIKWLRSVLVKSMIKSAAMKGMAETINSLLPILQQIQQPQGIKTQKREQVVELTQKDRTGGRGRKETMMMTWSKLTMINLLLVFICFLLTFYQFRIQYKYQALINHPIHWKGIYLRDLENVTESQIVLGGHVNPMTYELFQQDRLNVIDWKYKWNTREHKKVAVELSYSRERVGRLRYEILSLLRILNRVEYQLLENEYFNWLWDKKVNCEKNVCELIDQEIVYSSIS